MILEMQITRSKDTGKETLGELKIIGNPFKCFTVELPWKNNERGISCIPTGIYEVIKREPTDTIKQEHFLIENVPGRSGVCIHSANYFTQLKGCIAPGSAHADINGDGELDVPNSRDTMKKLLEIMPSRFKLTIVSLY